MDYPKTECISSKGHSRPNWAIHLMSGLPPIATELRTSLEVRFVPIVLKKSFLGDEQNFIGPLMRFACGDVRYHVVSHKNDHGPSYRRYGALQRQRHLKINFRENFGVVRFSTFATVSATFGHHPGAILDHGLPGGLYNGPVTIEQVAGSLSRTGNYFEVRMLQRTPRQSRPSQRRSGGPGLRSMAAAPRRRDERSPNWRRRIHIRGSKSGTAAASAQR